MRASTRSWAPSGATSWKSRRRHSPWTPEARPAAEDGRRRRPRGTRTGVAPVAEWEDGMTEKSNKAMDRRRFLRGLGGASTIAAAAVASPIAATDAHAYDPGPDETKARYRESDHVKAFYRTNGYETLKK